MSNETLVGLFLVNYRIGREGIVGGPELELGLAVNTPHQVVGGIGHIRQATNPAIDVAYNFEGTYTYMTVMPNNSHILVVCRSTTTARTATAPVELRLILESNWQSGVASYQYYDNQGVLHTVSDVPVRSVQ